MGIWNKLKKFSLISDSERKPNDLSLSCDLTTEEIKSIIPQESIISDTDEAEVLKCEEAVITTCNNGIENDNAFISNINKKKQKLTLIKDLNPEQEYAVTYNGKHLLVIAGAGTGKTKTIIERAKYLLSKGVPASKILILSFTRKSAREIVERIQTQTDYTLTKGIQGQTFHSWCMGIIKSHPDIFAQASSTLLDEDDRVSCIKIAFGKTINIKNGKSLKPDKILAIYSYAMNTLCSLSEAIRKVVLDSAPKDSEQVKSYIDLNKKTISEIIAYYINFKRSHNYIDYDDVLNIVSKALKNNEEVRKSICSLYEHILIDEMQDTNPLQYELLSSFFSSCSLFCVGDDAQSIYGFRGADFNSIHHFVEIVPHAEKCQLTRNYRSTQEILDLSNWLLKQSPLKYDKNLISVRGGGFKPQIIEWRGEYNEANDIAIKITESVIDKGDLYKDNLVLSRTAFGLRKIESALLEKKIPYEVFAGTGLLQSAHIRDVLSPLRIVANFLDEIAWMRYLQFWERIGDTTATQISGKILTASNFSQCVDFLMQEVQDRRLDDNIYSTLQKMYEYQTQPYKAIEIAYDKMEPRLATKYNDSWEWRSQDFPILLDISKQMNSILEFIAEYVLEPTFQTTVKGPGKEADKCILSTIHSAKGLEAKNCYITNVSTTAYPSAKAILNGSDAIEEERRCLYVALTRAKDNLYIYRNGFSHFVSGPLEKDDPSKYYFFNTLPSTLCEIKTFAYNNPSHISVSFNGVPVSIENEFDFS